MIRIFDYVIGADRRQYVVGKPVVVKRRDGTIKEEIREAAYVNTLGEALVTVYQERMRKVVRGEDLDLANACKRLQQMDEEFRTLVQKAILEANPEDFELQRFQKTEGKAT